MNTYELKIWDDEGKRCTFYTVHEDGSSDNETDKFFNLYGNDPEYEFIVNELLSFVLYTVGDDQGTEDSLFNRSENEVKGLPVQGKVRIKHFSYHFPNFPLRLYALKITDDIVVLFNGGVKDGPTNQTSSLSFQWREACGFAKRIIEAQRDGEILVDESNRLLTNHLGGQEIIF